MGGSSFAWGPTTHEKVLLEAVGTLPKQLRPFYRNHRAEMPSFDVEQGSPTQEGLEGRFAVDRLLPFPFADLPRDEAAFRERFGKEGESAGRLPWLIFEGHERLVDAFRKRDKAKILAESDRLAALVTDLHNPLALSDNADGQRTGQHGLWVRFAVKLPEAMGRRLKLTPDAAHLLDDPKEHVFSMISGTYVWLDNLLYQEELARRGQAGYTGIYYEALAGRTGEILKERLSRAAGEVGSYWYTAWTLAGRPELK